MQCSYRKKTILSPPLRRATEIPRGWGWGCVYYTINATINTLTKRIHRDEKILRLNSSFVCLFFTILKVFETKKGVIKILVYSSVIDINEMDVIFFAIIITLI